VRLLIAGRPGSGKTTAVARLAALLREAGVPVGGFVTSELRERGRRVGFEIETLDGGERAPLAHVQLSGPPRVGRYGVDLASFEALALPALGRSSGGRRVFLVDELGKMELASEPFRAAVSELFTEPVAVVATVQQKPHPFVTRLKRRSEVKTLQLTAANRERLPSEIAARLTRDRA
jgi:nucleoside-triphosphatase